MQRKVISFRLSQADLDTLEELREGNESVSQTAARLIKNILGSEELTDKESLHKTVDDLVNKKITTIIRELKSLDERLKKVEKLGIESISREIQYNYYTRKEVAEILKITSYQVNDGFTGKSKVMSKKLADNGFEKLDKIPEGVPKSKKYRQKISS